MKPPDPYLIRFMISAGQAIHVMVAKHIEDILIRIKGGGMKTDCGNLKSQIVMLKGAIIRQNAKFDE